METLIDFSIIVLFIFIGEWVSSFTKAYVPSVFVTAILFMVGFWTILPKDIAVKASFGPEFASVCLSLILVHLGTLMNLKELIQQWRAVCVALLGVIGTLFFTLTIGTLIFDWHTVVAAIPPLTGGLVAATLMTEGVKNAGLTSLVALPIAMFVFHSVIGYPLTSVMLKHEGNRLAKKFRKGELQAAGNADDLLENATSQKKTSKLPAEYHTAAYILFKIGLVALAANGLGMLFQNKVNVNILCLICGVIAHQLGFLEDSALNKAGVFQWLMYGLLAFVFAQLNITTPQIIGSVLVQIVVLMLLGLLGMFLASWLLAKPLGMSKAMAFSCALTALFGFPADYILTTEICHNVATSKEEEAVLLENMVPKMLVGGFATVSVASVVIASVFLELLK